MERLQNYIKSFIISEIHFKGFFYLSDNKLFLNDIIEPILNDVFNVNNKTYKIYSKKISDKTGALKALVEEIKKITDNETKKDTITLIEYQIFLEEQGFDNRYKKKIRDLITNFILENYKYLKVERDKYIFNPSKIEINFIDSLSDFISLSTNNFNSSNNVFYRGHANLMWKLIPSIYRDNNWIINEHKMFREIIIRNPEEFQNTKSTFEKLTIMQHYGLPTRLLDITKNPLVALYFACSDESEINNPGEIIIFTPEEETIKYYDSDTVSMISNLAKCERTLKIDFSKDDFNNNYLSGLKLLHLIKEEKPYFLSEMNPNDFNNTLFVRPINNNPRIKRQSGYFILFGIEEEIKYAANINSIYKKEKLETRFFIEESNKMKILKDLEGLGINGESLFPEIEKGTEYLKLKYKSSPNKGLAQ